MTHNRMLDRAPSVMITSKNNELKLYKGNIVYLNDGDNFELRFFNPLMEKIGIEINFNGLKKDGLLVLNPGQDINLDRFIDEQRKMVFETYTVDGNNEAAVKAIQENGIITFNFFKEKYSRSNYQEKDIDINYDFPPKPYKPNYKTTTTTTTTYYGSGSSGVSGIAGISGSSGGAGLQGCMGNAGLSGTRGVHFKSAGIPITTKDNSYIASTTTNIDYSEYIAENFESNINYTGYVADSLNTANKNSRTYDGDVYLNSHVKSLETGRIEKGEISNQTLRTVNANFSTTPFHSLTYKLMPASARNFTVGEIRQYCPDCGYRLRKDTWSFCPKCGNELN